MEYKPPLPETWHGFAREGLHNYQVEKEYWSSAASMHHISSKGRNGVYHVKLLQLIAGTENVCTLGVGEDTIHCTWDCLITMIMISCYEWQALVHTTCACLSHAYSQEMCLNVCSMHTGRQAGISELCTISNTWDYTLVVFANITDLSLRPS